MGQDRDDKGETEGFLFFIFKTGLMSRILVNKLINYHKTILLDEKTTIYC